MASAVSPAARIVPLEAPSEWRAALEGTVHGIAHTWEYCDAMASASGRPVHLIVIEGPTGRAVCPVAERTFAGEPDVVTPYGLSGFSVVGTVPDLDVRWRTFAVERGYVCGYLALNPVLPAPAELPSADLYHHNSVFVIDLDIEEGELWSRLSSNRRRQLRHWAEVREGLILDRERLTAFLVREYARFMMSRSAGPAYRLGPDGLERLCAMESAFLVGACSSDRLEAVSLFASTGHAGDFIFNISTPGGERHSAALIWYAVERMRRAGIPLLSLGGGLREGDRLAEFKRRFGARRLPLASLRQVFRPEAYRRLCALAGASSERRDGFFPPYHAGSAIASAARG